MVNELMDDNAIRTTFPLDVKNGVFSQQKLLRNKFFEGSLS